MSSTAKRNLKRARKIRHRQATELRALSAGHITLENVLRNPTDALGRCRVAVLMRHAPMFGENGVKRVLKRADVWPEERVANIPPEKVEAIISNLPERVRKH
jgi:hypothetical protein